MKRSTISTLCICLALGLLHVASYAATDPNNNTDKKKKKQHQEIAKELDLDLELQVLNDEVLDLEPFPKIKIYNTNNVLVYEEDVASLNDITDENIQRCFSNSNVLMSHNNVTYYILENK
ncbi:hypothetical protein QQ008_02185 [Fulvivirgaceae bacterium BMA10]|uniref:Uncharacterized protein n=1 Tax=Splendidivirga corallicola TaxID=3051826 RepID=A0ABT8KHF9_9BACT|nr:hypothetical protein [Fulvivirgaceae bacterium BMA10]